MQTTETPSETPRGSRTLRTLGIVLVAVVAVAAIGLGIAAIVNDDAGSSSATTGAQQVAFMQDHCQDWTTSYHGNAQLPANWCADMTAWMKGRATTGLMGSAAQLRAGCLTWTTGSTLRNTWCNQMTRWMNSRASGTGDRNDWMMNPNS